MAGVSATVGFNHLVEKFKSVNNPDEAFDEEYFRKNADQIFKTVDKLKGVPLKVAQILSLDSEIVPEAGSEVLSKSQHSASPLSYQMVWSSFLRTLDRGPDEIYEHFSKTAACAASIGQVHKATHNGHDYAVKIKYPGIEKTFEADLKFLRPLLGFIGFPSSVAQRFTAEIHERLLEEADYQFELRRSVEISTACKDKIENVRFPGYYPDVSSSEILTMDWIDGIPLDQFANSDASQAERDRIGQALWDFTFYQIHELHLFHADPSPGNYLVKDGQLWVLDFGCTKEIDEATFRAQFAPLKQGVLDSDEKLVSALEGLTDDFDREKHYEIFTTAGKSTVEILSRPFRSEQFNFGDPQFIKDVFGIHHTLTRDPELRRGIGFSTSADGIFLSRTWLGLYRLLARIKANVQINLPDWMYS